MQDDLVLRSKAFFSMNAPDKRDERSFKRWLFKEKPLFITENQYLEYGIDFVALAENRECGALDVGIAQLMDHVLPGNLSRKISQEMNWYMLMVLQRIFTTARERQKTDSKTLIFRSKTRIDICIRMLLTTTIVVLLVGPSAILFLVPGVSGLCMS